MKGAAGCELSEKQFVAIAFANVAEAMIVVLQGCREAGRHHVVLSHNKLYVAAGVIAAGVQCLCIRCAGRREN